MFEDFETAFEFIMKWEGGYVNNKKDPGGETKYGISKRSYPNLDIKNLTREDAKKIYLKDFWNGSTADEYPKPLNIVIFDTAVNMGISRALKFLEKTKDPVQYIALRRKRYQYLVEVRPSLKIFLKGWNNRLNDLEKWCKL